MAKESAVQKHVAILGFKAKDKITNVEGIITSINFDLYGCIQTLIQPPADKDGKIPNTCWFDVTRIELLSKKPVMDKPDFDKGYIADGKKGCAEKPTP